MYKLGFFLCILLVVLVQNCAADFTWWDCWLPVSFSAGPECKANLNRWRWDSFARKCIKVSYNGCNPTNNNFLTLQLCELTVGVLCKRLFPFSFP